MSLRQRARLPSPPERVGESRSPFQPRLFDPEQESEEQAEVRRLIKRIRRALRTKAEEETEVPWWHEK
jgi:hypothetical protein